MAVSLLVIFFLTILAWSPGAFVVAVATTAVVFGVLSILVCLAGGSR